MTSWKCAQRLWLCASAATLLIVPGLFTQESTAYVAGPPPETTGGFNEQNCRMCHVDYDLNDKSGSLRVEGIPESYKPGEQYVITIRLSHPQMERGGFQMSSRFASGEKMGRQAGMFEVTDKRVGIVSSTDGTIQYTRQTRDGSAVNTKGATDWSVRWQAPQEAAGPVVFHTAANAANYDDSPLGDFPYANESTSQPTR